MTVALKALLAFQRRNSRSLNDEKLQATLFAKIQSLELSVDQIGPTPLRHKLSELIVQMRTEIWAFDQSKELT